jgi:small conductance mechanosensitive channel
LYDLLTWVGVDPATARHLQQVVVKPVAVVVVVVVATAVGWVGSRVIRRWIGAVARRAAGRADSPRASARAVTITAMVANIWRVVIGVIAVFVALGAVGINLTPLLAGATVVGATIGFGAQSMVRDLLSGFLLIIEDQFDIGDTLTVGTTSGTVEDLSLRVTRLRGVDGTIWFVPNGEIRTLANLSRGWAEAMVDISVPAAADVDDVLSAVGDGANAVAQDARYAASCLAAPRLWGVVAADAETLTTRVSIRTPTAERERIARAIREEVAHRLRRRLTLDDPIPPGQGVHTRGITCAGPGGIWLSAMAGPSNSGRGEISRGGWTRGDGRRLFPQSGRVVPAMRGRVWTIRLLSVATALSCVAMGLGGVTTPAAAAAAPACTFNGEAFPLITNVTAGEQIAIACTGLPALSPFLVLQASLLIGIDPQAAALLSGGAPGPGTITAALAALPEIDAASFNFPVSDLNGNLSFTYTVPTIQATDPNATCPPTTPEINAGLLGCALAMVDLTTQKPVAAGSAVLEYQGEPVFPPNPTLALSATKAKAGDVVNVSDAPGATTYWWLATLVSLEALLSGGSPPPVTITVDFLKHLRDVPTTNNITVTPASYDGTTLTPPSISGSFTVPAAIKKGAWKVFVGYQSSLEGLNLVIGAQHSLKVKG